MIETKENYEKAMKAIETFRFYSELDKKIDAFIEMLTKEKYTGYELGRPDNNNVFGINNQISFEGYENIEGLNTSHFWINNSRKIKEKVKELKEQAQTEEEKLKYEKVVQAIDNYEFTSQLERRIDVFIGMMSKGKYTQYIDGKPDNNNIFSVINQIPFEGYENIKGLNTSGFWISNSSKIIERLNQLSELSLIEEEQLKNRKDVYNILNPLSLDKKIDAFIEMLSKEEYTGYELGRPDQNNIFGTRNQIPFEGYENIEGLNTSQFWSRNSATIKSKVKELKEKSETEEEKLKYEKVVQAIDNYEFTSQLERRIEAYIEMLSKEKYSRYEMGRPDNNNVFGVNNQIPFEGYEKIEGLNTSLFWRNNSTKIKEYVKELKSLALTEEEKLKYEKVERAIDNYDFLTQIDKKIEVYIEMLTKEKYTNYVTNQLGQETVDQNNIFGYNNQIPFEGYERIEGLNTSQFWSHNSKKIIDKLFYGEYKDNLKYAQARESVLKYLKVNTIEEYEDKLDKIKNQNNILNRLKNSNLREMEVLEQANQILSSEVYDNNKEGKVI